MKRLITICLASLLGMAANATEHNTPADISISCNQNGAIVEVSNGSTYYLGNSCDASQPGVGEGRWWYAASAFIVEINGQSVRFSNELTCEITYCRP